MTALRTWLVGWWRGRTRARGSGDAPDAPILPPAIQAQIEATVAQLEATFTQRTVAQIQAELGAAAAEERLAAYIAVWLQRSVEELSSDLLRGRQEQRGA